MRNRQPVVSRVEPFVFAPKIEYQLVAERSCGELIEPSEANLSNLRIPFWCRGRESNPHRIAPKGF